MRKIAVALSKGGVGKTTSVVNLAAGLVRAGKKVLLVDTDTQNQAAKSLGCQPQAGLAELVSGEAPPERAMLPALDRRVRKSEEILEQLRTHYQGLVCPPVRYNVRLSEAPGQGQTIFEYAPNSPGAEDYHGWRPRFITFSRNFDIISK